MNPDKTPDIDNIKIAADHGSFPATHEEIISRAATDIYFLPDRMKILIAAGAAACPGIIKPTVSFA